MKTGYRLLTEEVFSKNIHLLNIERSESDKSLVNIILTLSEGNVDSFIPTIQENNDVRKFIYSLNNRIEIKKLSCGHQGIESQNSLYIQFNLDLNDNDLSDDFIENFQPGRVSPFRTYPIYSSVLLITCQCHLSEI